MMTIVLIVLGLVVLAALIGGSRVLRRYWEAETNMSDEDYAFDRRVASYNDKLANQQRDEDIVRVLGGREMPTVADRYQRDDDK